MVNTEPTFLATIRRDKFQFPPLTSFQSHGIRKKCGLILPVIKLATRELPVLAYRISAVMCPGDILPLSAGYFRYVGRVKLI